MSTDITSALAKIDQRLSRIEKNQRNILTPDVIGKPLTMPESEVMVKYKVSRSRLKQLRKGYSNKGIFFPAQLFKWTHINGRKLEYNVRELEQVFKRKTQYQS